MHGLDHHRTASSKNHSSYPHSKLLDTFLLLLGYLGEIFYPGHHQLPQDFQEKAQVVNEENAFSNTCNTPSLSMPQATLQHLLDMKVT